MITGNLRYIMLCCVPCLKRDVIPEQIHLRIEQLKQDIQYHPLDVALHFKVAIEYLRLDNFLAAKNHFNEILKRDPTGHRLPQLNLLMGAAELMFGDVDKAIDHFNLQKQGRASYETYALLAIACLEKNRPDRALEEVNRAIETERKGVNSLTLRGLIYEVDGKQMSHAIKDYEEILRHNPTHIVATERIKALIDKKRETERLRKTGRGHSTTRTKIDLFGGDDLTVLPNSNQDKRWDSIKRDGDRNK